MQYNHIAIEGNIGSGKTTLAGMLAADYNVRLILEKFADNPFLPKFYKEPEKNAFPLELFFMAERYHQLKSNKEQDLFQPQKVSDYFFVKSKLFAQNNVLRESNDEVREALAVAEERHAARQRPALGLRLVGPISEGLARLSGGPYLPALEALERRQQTVPKRTHALAEARIATIA